MPDCNDGPVARCHERLRRLPHGIGGARCGCPRDRYKQVGNAAGLGARQALLSLEQRKISEDFIDYVDYIELTTHPHFQDIFIKAMYLHLH